MGDYDDVCYCPTCGRGHTDLKFGSPPDGVAEMSWARKLAHALLLTLMYVDDVHSFGWSLEDEERFVLEFRRVVGQNIDDFMRSHLEQLWQNAKRR